MLKCDSSPHLSERVSAEGLHQTVQYRAHHASGRHDICEALLRLTVANTVGTTCTKRVACTHSHSSRLAKVEYYAPSENQLLLRYNDLMKHDDGD